MKPMLFHRYEDKRHLVHYPWYIQPKLNGIRLIAFGGALQTRSYSSAEPKTFLASRLRHIREALSIFPSRFLIDGELYVHGWSLQKINGAASVNSSSDGPHSHLLEYHIFDIVNTEALDDNFAERAQYLSLFHARLAPPLFVVETVFAQSEIQGDAHYAAWKHFLYEGAVYRDPDKPYGFAENCGNKENRWAYGLKRKDYLDEVCKIIAVIEGNGKHYGTVGSFVLELPNGIRFQSGTGLNDFHREAYWSSPPIGRFCKIKYFGLSEDGIPTQSTIEAVLD